MESQTRAGAATLGGGTDPGGQGVVRRPPCLQGQVCLGKGGSQSWGSL